MNDLSIEDIHNLMDLHEIAGSLDIEIVDEIDSTNNYLKKSHTIKDQSIKIIIAKKQTTGRGQHDKKWISEYDAGLWMSVALDIKNKYNPAAIPLVAGAAIANELSSLGAKQIGLKWPNDLIYENQKLGGILVESVPQKNNLRRIIIGLGINTRLPKSVEKIICSNFNPIALESIIKETVPINMLCANIIKSLNRSIRQFERNGFSSFIKEWAKFDILVDRQIIVENSSGSIEGNAHGISAEGALLLSNEDGIHQIISGSVRCINNETML
jgi:BirA family biotin operon repressor/biotin-[acetyl-CoA-carboxylase] ligase